MQIPPLVALPRGLLELMLHIEQPYAGGGGEQYDWKVHEQERLKHLKAAFGTASERAGMSFFNKWPMSASVGRPAKRHESLAAM